jgi:hypothetical protein
MNIYTVRDNLKNTIAGKEMLLETYKNPSVLTKQIRETMTHMLEINIDELKRILGDVEQCCEQATAASWATNPDRSGGQFTQDEIDNADRWV